MEDKEYTIDLVDMARLLKENRKPIFKITFIIVGIISCILLVLAMFFPKYDSISLLRIKQERGGGGIMAALAGYTGGFLSQDSLQMDSYIAIAKSRSVIIPIIEATEEANKDGKYPRYEEYLKTKINIQTMPLTDILQITIKGETPEKAQKVNQMLIEGFLKKVADLNSSEKRVMKGFLDERLKEAREDMDKAAAALDQFKAEHKIISAEKNADIFAGRIIEAEKQMAVNQIELQAAEARAAAINSQLYGSGAAIADNQIVEQYKKQLAELETTRISYREKYTAKHPRMIDLEERIGQLKAKIQEEQQKVASLQAPTDNAVHQGLVAGKYQSESTVAMLRKKAEALQQVIDQNNAELEKLPEVQRGYVKLARDFSVANEIYLVLVKKMAETKVTELQTPNNVQVVDEPTLSDKRSFPNLKLGLALAIFLGLLISCGYVILKELLHKTIRGKDDLTQILDCPVLGMIPDEAYLAQLDAAAAAQQEKEPGWKDKVKEYIWKR